MEIAKPYLLFLGDVQDELAAKTAHGIVDWRPDWCVGQHRLAGCKADCGLTDLSIRDAAAKGAKTMIVGTDCSVGKKYTALAMDKAMRQAGFNCDFRATGQTGVFISGRGLAIDAVIADFIAGAAEWLSPENDPKHWDIVEGQGSLFHPSFAGVTLGLLHGAQPDAFIVCHEPTRSKMRGVDHALPTIADVIERTIAEGRLTNPAIQCVGIAVNTEHLEEKEALACLAATAAAHGLPAVDPIRTGVGPLVAEIEKRFGR